jgi:hypothetical protein
MSVDPHRDRTLACVSLLINLKKSMVKHFKHRQGESDYMSSAPKCPKKHCLICLFPDLARVSFS